MLLHPKQAKAFELARGELGTEEVPGPVHNDKILSWFKKVGHDIKDDETSWCAAFLGAMLEDAGLPSTKALTARSYLKWGEEVPLSEAKTGDIVVFWRISPTSWQGHAGFFNDRKDGKIYVLGGNQGNKVSVAPYAETQLLGVRRMPAPPKVTIWDLLLRLFQKLASGGSKQKM